MAYQVGRREAAEKALARIIGEQADKIEAESRAAEKAPAAFIHKARVRCKRIRAALRLAQPMIGAKARKRADRWWRDAARLLREVRDATAQTEALETLRPALIERVDAASVRALAARIRLQHRLSGVHRRETAAIRLFRERLSQRATDVLEDADKAGADELHDGLLASYRAARRAMRVALSEGAPEAFHEWRKQAKAHSLQLRALRDVFPLIGERIAAVRDLAECLGAIQDVAVLQQALTSEVGVGIDPRIRDALLAEREKMQDGAVEQGEALFGEKPKAWARRALERSALDRQPAASDL